MKLLFLVLLAQASDRAAAEKQLAATVIAGRTCATAESDPTQLNCRFKVDSAAFEIAGVGADDAQLAVYRADSASTYVAFGKGHQCAMVKTQKAVVFVSLKNAKVYTYWGACADSASTGK
jgi:hypothetical protein